MWRRHQRKGPSDPRPETVADTPDPQAPPQNEFDAYLTGAYVRWLECNGQPVPGMGMDKPSGSR